jgi:hypothetical protein
MLRSNRRTYSTTVQAVESLPTLSISLNLGRQCYDSPRYPYRAKHMNPTNDNSDLQQLRLLSIFHYVYAGLLGLFALFPLIYVALGVAMVSGSFELQQPPNQRPVPEFVGWVFVAVGSITSLVCALVAFLVVLSGRRIASVRKRTFCVVISSILCIFFPIGTVLGIFSLVVLLKPSVKALFEANDFHSGY